MKLQTALRGLLLLPGLLSVDRGLVRDAAAQTSASAATRQIGTIQSLDAGHLTLKTDKGDMVTVEIGGETKVVQLPVGSTDLKAAQTAAITDLAVGDRVLAIGGAGTESGSVAARRLVLMKSTDIAARREAEQAGWQHGSGGIVSAVDTGSGIITLAAGARTLKVATGPETLFRRYSPTSARFEDATKSSVGEVHAGDQMRVRGDRADDGSIKAQEVVSGSFRHLSGTIQGIDSGTNQMTVRDLTTKKAIVLSLSPGTAIHQLPPEVAARFAARTKASAGGGSSTAAAGQPARPAGDPGAARPGTETGPRGGGGDLSQIVAKLPAANLSDLKAGEAVMVVGSDGPAGSIAALTVVSGVEPILAASPNGGAEVALAPWSMGGGEAGSASAQ